MKKKLFIAAVAALAAAACGSGNNELPPAPTEPLAPRASTPLPPRVAEPPQQVLQRVAGERVFFGFDSSTLSPEARAVLREQANFLNANPTLRIRVEGNADERGTREYNLALGARRANAAKDFLVGLGVNPSRIDTISYGKDRPLDPRSTEAAWAMNRNARTFVVGGTLSS